MHDEHSLWWEGVACWYNEQDYMTAISLWERAVDEETSDPSSLALLMVFLAGSVLDAGEYEWTRSLCRRALEATSWGSGNECNNNELTIRAMNDLMAAHEEDPSISQAWKESYQIVQDGIDRGVRHWNNPYQRPGYLNNLISGQQLPVPTQLPTWCDALEKAFPQILQEFHHLLGIGSNSSNNAGAMPTHWPRVGSGEHRDGAGQHDGSVVSQNGDWREAVLFGSGGNPHQAPQTAALLQRHVPDAVDLANQGGGEIIFSLLAPKTRIKPHCASHNLRLTAHLGLVVPQDTTEKCAIRVADTWHTWKPGKILVFDDSFEHEVVNDTNEVRAVLLIRFWHTELPVSSRLEALEGVIQAKRQDGTRRCNPPLPQENAAIRLRGEENSICDQCGQTGYTSIRMTQIGMFSCTCGLAIN